jgi:hypothetical protein
MTSIPSTSSKRWPNTTSGTSTASPTTRSRWRWRDSGAPIQSRYEALNDINDNCWAGAFTYWHEQRLMVWRYGLVLTGGQMANPEQIDRLIGTAVGTSERFYPAFQLVTWGGRPVGESLQVAIAEAYGRA